MGEVDENLMESSSDFENIEQVECSSGSELLDRLSKLYTERELLSETKCLVEQQHILCVKDST